MLAKRANPKDGRAVLLSLTRAGRSLIARHSAEIRAINDIFFGTLTPSMFAAASAAMAALVRGSARATASLHRPELEPSGVKLRNSDAQTVARCPPQERLSCSEKTLVKFHCGDKLHRRLYTCPPLMEDRTCIVKKSSMFGGVRELVVAGWTGRDVAALEKHIRELEAIGVKRPKTTPIFYRVAGVAAHD